MSGSTKFMEEQLARESNAKWSSSNSNTCNIASRSRAVQKDHNSQNEKARDDFVPSRGSKTTRPPDHWAMFNVPLGTRVAGSGSPTSHLLLTLLEVSGSDRPTSRVLVRSQQARKLRLLQNQPFVETPRAAAPLVLEVNPMRPGARMPKGVPEHREIVAIRAKPNDMLDTDSIGIAALEPVGNAQRAALTLASTEQEALIPPAWGQLIPDEGGYAA